MSTQVTPNVSHCEAGEELAHKALRFLTAGSVDDGKSTLIGRLLFDSRAILADQLDALEKRAAGAPIDLSLLTDGLEAEREQGITIDVAYRYFATKTRKFIIADAPGHEQYTRNMVTAAAGSDAAVVLVDITKIDWKASPVPLLAQTRRHSLLAHLLRVPSIVFAINKLDAIEQDTEVAFNNVKASLEAFAEQAGIVNKGVIPVSALRGDNVTTPSANWPWYKGPTLLQVLEELPVTDERHDGSLLHPVQYVTRDSVGEGEANASGTGHQYRTGAASPTAQSRPATKCRSSRAARPPWSPKCATRPWSWTNAKRASRPASCWTARSTSRAATGSTPLAPSSPPTASPPPWPGSTPSPPWSAASTGCAMATAGCRPAFRPSKAAWTSIRWKTPTHSSWPSTRSAACRSRPSSRCRSSPTSATASVAP